MRLITLIAALVASVQAVTWNPISTGFTRPLLVTGAKDGSNRLFVVQQGGKVIIVDKATGTKQATPFLDVSDLISTEALRPSGYTERGLLGFAFHPEYKRNGQFFINYTAKNNGTTIVARYTRSATNPEVADPTSATVILSQPQPYSNHNGGMMAFGKDGFLYIAFGDGGSGGDPQNFAQNMQSWLGKMLRIDVNNAERYIVPTDNPFVGQANVLPEIFGYGLRNPWRFSFDAVTGDMWIGDVGQNAVEEIDFVPNTNGKLLAGLNFGWGIMEGNRVYRTGSAVPANHYPPILELTHSDDGVAAITGGYVYRGSRVPELVGKYLFSDWSAGVIWTADQNAATGNWTKRVVTAATDFSVASFGEDDDRDVYVVDNSRQGRLLRLDA